MWVKVMSVKVKGNKGEGSIHTCRVIRSEVTELANPGLDFDPCSLYRFTFLSTYLLLHNKCIQ